MLNYQHSLHDNIIFRVVPALFVDRIEGKRLCCKLRATSVTQVNRTVSGASASLKSQSPTSTRVHVFCGDFARQDGGVERENYGASPLWSEVDQQQQRREIK